MKDFESAWQEFEPWLTSQETRRKAAVRLLYISILIAVLLAGLVVLAAAYLQFSLNWIILLPVGAAALVLMLGSDRIMILQKEVKDGLYVRMGDVLGLTYTPKPAKPEQFDRFVDHGLVPVYDECSFANHFSGTANAAWFELYEASLGEIRKTQDEDRYISSFDGLLVRICYPRAIKGVTLVTRDKGVFNKLEHPRPNFNDRSGEGLERVGFADEAFESVFEVYSTNQVMARELLTPSVIDRLLDLEKLLEGSYMKCVFCEALGEGAGQGEILISARRDRMFESASMLKPLDDKDQFAELYDEIATIHAIIEILLEPDDIEQSAGAAKSPEGSA